MPFAHAGEAMYSRLTAAVADTAAAGRVYPQLPELNAELPYLVYYRQSGGGDVVLGGRSLLQRYVYRVDVYAADEASGEAILTALNDEATGLPGWSDPANRVQGILPVDDADTSITADEEELRVPGQSYSIWFTG